MDIHQFVPPFFLPFAFDLCHVPATRHRHIRSSQPPPSPTPGCSAKLQMKRKNIGRLSMVKIMQRVCKGCVKVVLKGIVKVLPCIWTMSKCKWKNYTQNNTECCCAQWKVEYEPTKLAFNGRWFNQIDESRDIHIIRRHNSQVAPPKDRRNNKQCRNHETTYINLQEVHQP